MGINVIKISKRNKNMDSIKTTFPGGRKVNALVRGFEITTDQPVVAGGEDSAPTPFELFLASLVTCAGIYVLNFILERKLSTQGLELTANYKRNPETKLVENYHIEITLPKDFPAKYQKAVINTAELCTVKKHLHQPPKIEITIKQDVNS
jgi:ribosomal protein S12 methylthiotransferase accessory factor